MPASPKPPPSLGSWEFPGWGTARRLPNLDPAGVRISHLDQETKRTLGEWPSTAICGNDITSSCLYVSALCAAQAGAYAPIALAIVAAAVTVALVAVTLGLIGNVMIHPDHVRVFGGYFLAAVAIVGVMFLRVQLLKLVLLVSRAIVERLERISDRLRAAVLSKIEDINSRKIVYYTKGADPAELNRAALYVRENEPTNNLLAIHAYDDQKNIPKDLARHLKTIDKLYPRLRIDFLAIKGVFGPELIEALSVELDVPKNYQFIGTPGDRCPHRIDALGGVRVIL